MRKSDTCPPPISMTPLLKQVSVQSTTKKIRRIFKQYWILFETIQQKIFALKDIFSCLTTLNPSVAYVYLWCLLGTGATGRQGYTVCMSQSRMRSKGGYSMCFCSPENQLMISIYVLHRAVASIAGTEIEHKKKSKNSCFNLFAPTSPSSCWSGDTNVPASSLQKFRICSNLWEDTLGVCNIIGRGDGMKLWHAVPRGIRFSVASSSREGF